MLLLPTIVRHVLGFCDKKESGARWATTGVKVEHNPETKKWRVIATDTKRLLVVEGSDRKHADEYPMPPALAKAPNGKCEALVPQSAFDEAFRQAEKITKTSPKPILKNVAMVMGATTVTMASTNLDRTPVTETRILEGRFPPIDDIINLRPAPKACVAFDAAIMSECLASLSKMAGRDTNRVEMYVYGEGKPVIMQVQIEDQDGRGPIVATALVMPLADSGGEDARPTTVSKVLGVKAPEKPEKKAKAKKEEHPSVPDADTGTPIGPTTDADDAVQDSAIAPPAEEEVVELVKAPEPEIDLDALMASVLA